MPERSENTPRPNFFLVGAPKAGTSSLNYYLGQHPDVYMSAFKEPHYFTHRDGWPNWRVKTEEEYFSLFAAAGEARAIGEASTWYLYSPTAAEAIHEYDPEARIVILLRAPAERAYSAWSFNLQKGRERHSSFEAALAAEDRYASKSGYWDHHYVRASRYADQVERYLRVFGAERVHVILNEELRRDPAGVMQELYTFLGVDATFTPEVSRSRNQTAMPRSSGLNRLIKRSSPVRRAARHLLPKPVGRWVERFLRSANTRPRPHLDPALRAQLDAGFRNDVRRLEDLLGRGLSAGWLRDRSSGTSHA